MNFLLYDATKKKEINVFLRKKTMILKKNYKKK